MKTMTRILAMVTAVGVMAGAACRVAHADEAACQAVLDAVLKQAGVPVHQKVSIESAAAPGRRIESEVIRLGDALYIQMRGQWMKRPYDAAKAQHDAREAMGKSQHECTRLRSEAVGGQAADLYEVRTRGPEGNSDAQIWISSSSGLPLRQHSEMATAGGQKSRHEVSFDYTDVKAPIQ